MVPASRRHYMSKFSHQMYYRSMRAVIQRVSQSSVSIKGKVMAKISQGLLVLLAIASDDTQKDADYLAKKILNLRLMNLSILDSKGEILVVSQFTLYADTKKGNRPNFVRAAPANLAQPLYNYFVTKLEESGLTIKTGQFGALMQVHLINDGPVTIIIDSHG